jgi:flagellar hook-length control protein FliK
MFAIPMSSGNLAASLKGAKPADAVGERLNEMLVNTEGLEPGFAAELHALLLNLTPQMLQRLESLVAGGIDLPQAARQLLGDLAALPPQGWLEGASAALRDGDGQMGMPVAARDATLSQLLRPANLASPGGDAGPATAIAPSTIANPSGADSPLRAALPPQLTSSLLDMGVPQPVGSRSWPGALAERVVWMTQGDQQFARLTLNPPHLGPLEVRVSISQDQTSVTFVAAHAAVREAIEAAMPRLRELFDQQSLALVHAEVADPGAQQDRAHQDIGPRPRSHISDEGPGQAPDDAAEHAAAMPGIVARGLVDLFA